MKRVLVTLLLPGFALAFSGGPPNGYTGAPGKPTCVVCHSQFPLNSGEGNISFGFLGPNKFSPGEVKTLTVSVQDANPSQMRWGFELTDLGLGAISPSGDGRTQLSGNYLKHTSFGTDNGTPGGTSWTFDWTAPVDPEITEVIFYAAGNAANAASGNQGDYIYSTALTLTRANPAPDPVDDLSIETGPPGVAFLSWDPVPGATAYRIYRSSQADGPFTEIDTTDGTSAIVAMPSETARFFRVTSLN